MTEAEITAKAHELHKGKSAYSDRQRAKFIRLMTSMVAPLNQLRADKEAKIAAAHASLAEKKTYHQKPACCDAPVNEAGASHLRRLRGAVAREG